jgi:hypothetical protein
LQAAEDERQVDALGEADDPRAEGHGDGRSQQGAQDGTAIRGGEAGEGGLSLSLTPLVYIPVSDTLFWENSCASGSAAAGMVLAARAGGPVSLSLDEPGGTHRVESDPAGETLLQGRTKRIAEYFQ